MDNEKNLKMAQNTYNTLCAMCDDIGLKYERHDDDLVLTCTIGGDDLPMRMIIFVHADRQLVRLISPMPFTVPEDKRMEVAVAANIVNSGIVDGSFDLDMGDGSLQFKLTSSFMESILGKELFKYMLGISSGTVDDYNDKFFMLAKGAYTLEQFIENIPH